ncbi:helical backbone metal receptor [Vibrio sp. HB161653]|uniref:Helical backbone metal receptor n=2 Tax=unclassified Vibrio TaxID=2614977 RepID=A0AB39HGE9_9VIBR|nr:helical backbone metal receptor [Vibrio sp. HB161653]MDP5254564.1 helical backbone metal receptor [Vibrio sp. HB161653]
MSRLLLLTLLLTTNSWAAMAHRVITLSPHATELAASAGLLPNIVAVSEASDFPPSVIDLPKVANYHGLNIEKIVALKPDLIIAWPNGNPQKEVLLLKKLGFHIVDSAPQTLAEIADNIDMLSHYSANPSVGRAAAAEFRLALTRLKQQYHTQRPVRYYFQVSAKPSIAMSDHDWPSDIFRFCGGKNIFADAPNAYPQVNIEQVALKAPEVIFTNTPSFANDWQALNAQIPALAKGQVWSLNSDWLTRATVRSLEAVKQVCQFLSIAREKH